MKHLWFSLGILAVLFALSIGAFSLLRSETEETLWFLTRAQAAAEGEDMAAAHSHGAAAKQAWEAHEGFIDMIMSHEETDVIHREFSDLLVYAQTGKREEFLSSCGKLLVMVEHLTEMERPIWRNLLCRLPAQ